MTIDLELTYIRRPDGGRTLAIADDRRAAAIEFLRTGGRKTAAEIEALVDEGHVTLLDAIAGLSEAQAVYKPSPDEWSMLELMSHVVSAKQIVAMLAPSLGDGRLPPGFGPAIETEAAQDGVTVTRFATLAVARAAADEAHQSLIAFVRRLDGDVNTDLTFKHFVFGDHNSREWCVFQRLHDDNHAPQARAIRASTGFPPA